MATEDKQKVQPHLLRRNATEMQKMRMSMAANTMDMLQGLQKKKVKRICADKYHACILPGSAHARLVLETPQGWVLSGISSIGTSERHLLVGRSLCPEYSIPCRLLDARWGESLALVSFKLLHFVFATAVCEQSPNIQIKKRALARFLASSETSISSSQVKKALGQLKELSVTFGLRRLLNRRRPADKVEKVFENVLETGSYVEFKLSGEIWGEFRAPGLYAYVGLEVIRSFTSLHSALLFTAMLGDETVTRARHTSTLRRTKAQNKQRKLEALQAGYDMSGYEHVDDWEQDWHEIRLFHLADLIRLPNDDANRQAKRIQRRIVDAAQKMNAVFGKDYVGPIVEIHPDYGSQSLLRRRNEAVETGCMKLAIRLPWRPVEYSTVGKARLKAFELPAPPELFVSPKEFCNALALAGFDPDDPQLASVILVDWKVFLWRNRERISNGTTLSGLFAEYLDSLIKTGWFDALEEIGIVQQVAEWWSGLWESNHKLIDDSTTSAEATQTGTDSKVAADNRKKLLEAKAGKPNEGSLSRPELTFRSARPRSVSDNSVVLPRSFAAPRVAAAIEEDVEYDRNGLKLCRTEVRSHPEFSLDEVGCLFRRDPRNHDVIYDASTFNVVEVGTKEHDFMTVLLKIQPDQVPFLDDRQIEKVYEKPFYPPFLKQMLKARSKKDAINKK